jgi:hypothetical protein
VSVYIADAPVQALPLIGGEHDWAYLLGSRGFDAMHLSDEIARFVELTGALLAITGIGIAVSAVALGLREPQPDLKVIPLTGAPPVGPGLDPWLEAADLPFKHEQAG